MQKNNIILSLLILATLFVLSACSGKEVNEAPAPIETKATRLEKRSQEETRKYDYPAATKAAHNALLLYALLDDREGQLRSHINLTRLYLLQEQRDKADKHLAKARSLAKEMDDQSQMYHIHLLSGKMNNDQDEFHKALVIGDTPLKKAVAETYLQNYDQAYALIENEEPESSTEEDDMAFVMLQYARFADHEEAGEKALEIFKKNENTVGISDSLYVLASIAKKQGDNKKAEHYLRRALEVNLAMGNKRRIEVIVKELEAL